MNKLSHQAGLRHPTWPRLGSTLNTLTLLAATLTAVVVDAVDATFSKVILDMAYIAYERDVGDINSDGKNDIVAIQEGNECLDLFRAPDSKRSVLFKFGGQFRWPRADDLKLADLDADGDLDVVTRLGDGPASDGPGLAVWLENTSRGTAFTQRVIGRSTAYAKDIVVADFDGDKRPDVAMRMDSATQLWLQNPDRTWSEVTLSHPPHEGLEAGDLDLDGRPDLVMNGFWFPTPRTAAAARDPANYLLRTIDRAWFTQGGDWTANSCKVVLGDFDGDGRNDVAFSQSERAGHEVAWYRSATPHDDASWQRFAVARVDFCHNLQAADFDLDGRVDLLAGGMVQSAQKGLTWHRNLGGGTQWSPVVIQREGSYSAELGDIDNDGDLDIVGTHHWNSGPSWIYRNGARSGQ
jgi:hypothetical protein